MFIQFDYVIQFRPSNHSNEFLLSDIFNELSIDVIANLEMQ